MVHDAHDKTVNRSLMPFGVAEAGVDIQFGSGYAVDARFTAHW